jgi:hypothetical protein
LRARREHSSRASECCGARLSDEVEETATAVPRPIVTCENARGQSWCVCGRARYVLEPRLRAPSPLCARRDRDDGPPDGDDARRRDGERQPGGDAHLPDASVTVPFSDFLPILLFF